jgi:hypothetical protein
MTARPRDHPGGSGVIILPSILALANDVLE